MEVRAKERVTAHEMHRRRLGLTGDGLAAFVGYSGHTFVSHVECRRRAAPAVYRARVARLFQVAESSLFDDGGFAR